VSGRAVNQQRLRLRRASEASRAAARGGGAPRALRKDKIQAEMRIAIDARKLRDYGVGTYVRNLLRHLSRLDSSTEYVLLCQQRDFGIAQELGENFRLVREDSPGYSVREQWRIPLRLRRERPHLFHAPHYVLPPLTPCKSVVTIHDCIHLRFPQYLPNRLGYAYARGSMSFAAHRSSRILTVSEASKRDILHYFHIPASKIDVIYNAIDERFSQKPTEDEVERVRERYQLNDPFVLYTGNIKPHKNLERLIEAFHLFRKRGFDQVKLLIIGDQISKYATLRRAVHRHNLHKHVRFFGFVPDQTLAVLYRLAAVFVFPSLYEGFGLPPLEAMASGTPVITSNVSSLPEVVGDAALLIDPYEPEAIAEAMCTVLNDADLRFALRERGFARARHFSWERSVQRIRQIYEEVLAS
jgi:glycosyltransferase involved in cell wall biosynthesis